MYPSCKLLAALALFGSAVCTTPARAETVNTCAGFIDSLPATISTQGVWCLNKNLSTNITSRNAITIAANNVTIDCNDFKIGGLAAGDSSRAVGIYADNRQNATVRHCVIRGFYRGIYLDSGAGHLVEDNRLDNNLYHGISVGGRNNRVRRNAVYDTGGYTDSNFPDDTSYPTGISASADVIDNTVAGVFATGTNTYPRGINMFGQHGGVVQGNRVRGLVVTGSGLATAIRAGGNGVTVADNRVSATEPTLGIGLLGEDGYTFCTGNTVINYSTVYMSCNYFSLDNLDRP